VAYVLLILGLLTILGRLIVIAVYERRDRPS